MKSREDLQTPSPFTLSLAARRCRLLMACCCLLAVVATIPFKAAVAASCRPDRWGWLIMGSFLFLVRRHRGWKMNRPSGIDFEPFRQCFPWLMSLVVVVDVGLFVSSYISIIAPKISPRVLMVSWEGSLSNPSGKIPFLDRPLLCKSSFSSLHFSMCIYCTKIRCPSC